MGYTKTQLRDPSFRGDPFDKDMSDGPKGKRNCTDSICCLLFVLFIVGMGVVAAKGFATGSPEFLAAAYDYDGNEFASPKFRTGLWTLGGG